MRGPVLWCAAMATAVLSSFPAAAKSLAFVVGIDRYENLSERQQLQKAVNDARAVAAAFRKLAFQVSPAGENLDRAAFATRWAAFLDEVEEGDTTAVFFSGHGVEIENKNYLILSDVPRLGPGREKALVEASVSLLSLREALEARGARVRLFILDACRDNPFRSGEKSAGGAHGLSRIEAPEGEFIMYSAAARQIALDRLSNDDDAPNSVYTRNLLPLLATPGLTLQELARTVRAKVYALAATARPPHRQVPAYYDGLTRDVCLAGGCPE